MHILVDVLIGIVCFVAGVVCHPLVKKVIQ